MEDRIKELENKVDVLTKNLVEVLGVLNFLEVYDDDKGYLKFGYFTLDGFSSCLLDFNNSIEELKSILKSEQTEQEEE